MRGFILLEVLVSIMISSMIFMSLMGALFQLSKARVSVDDSIDVYTRVTTIVNLMQQDFQGSMIPVQAEVAQEKKQTPVGQPQQKNEPQVEKQEAPQTTEQQAGAQEKTKPVKDIFYSSIKDNNVAMISCITNNPTTVYWSERAGKAKPRVMRIVYTLVPDPAHKESFLLKRQEGSELDLDAYKNSEKPIARAYEIAEGIKQFKITYLYLEKKEEAQPQQEKGIPQGKQKEAPTKEQPQKKEPAPKPDYKAKADWLSDAEEKKDQKSQKDPLFPSHMVVSLLMFNSTYKTESPFEFVVTLDANEAQQLKQAQMRYKQEAQNASAGAQKPAEIAPKETEPKEDATHEDSEKTINLFVFNKGSAPEKPQEKNSAHELLAENLVHSSMQQFYEDTMNEREQGNNEQTMPENANENSGDSEQVDELQGKIDIVHDGDRTHIVYQGPIALTHDSLRGIS